MHAGLFTPGPITVRGLLGEQKVDALTLGDWAVHRQIDTPDLFGITVLPIGLSLPFCWASFRTRGAALRAAREIVRIRNSWARLTQADFTVALRDRLMAICARHGAVEGPVQLQWPADLSLLGLPIGRPNGYALPA